ncbi:hypothetical protein COS86_06520 [Candidatus Bathyarchaeota archaeon CG07_land_8_20_14_0_80_47_9]|nr:MAG: hypothetical protein COS86_06520 [Candidatus Bathyarchaeota archaeon CG07_land_8_20_14_0_80_47_9]
MTLIGARRWRIELSDCRCGRHYIVTVEPVIYVGKAEFKNFAAAFRRLFMDLEKKWRWTRSFTSQIEAQNFAKALAKFLEELAYVDNGSLCLATPRGGS